MNMRNIAIIAHVDYGKTTLVYQLLAQSAAALEAGGWLAAGARVYLELPASMPLPGLPPAWRLVKSGRAGDVGYHLARSSRGAPPA